MRIFVMKQLAYSFALSLICNAGNAANCTSHHLLAGFPSQAAIAGNNTTQMVPTVTAVPGSTGTVSVQYSTSANCIASPQTATWQNWPAGDVSTVTSDSLVGIVNCVQALATNVNGTLEVCE